MSEGRTEFVPLSEPIEAHGEELKSLTLRAPRGEDLIAAGYPFRLLKSGDDADNDDVAIEIVPGAVAKLTARLANIPPSAVKRMSGVDFNACMETVLGFFDLSPAKTEGGESNRPLSTDPSTSPGSGSSPRENSSD